MIWSVGIANIDVFVCGLPAWPETGGLERADSVQIKPGGVALNTSLTVARLGGLDCSLIAAVGADAGGEWLRSEAQQFGVVTDKSVVLEGRPTGVCLVFVHSDSERSFVCGLSANDELSDRNIDLDGVSEGDHVHLGGILDTENLRGESLARLLERVRATGGTVSADTAWDSSGAWWTGLAASLPLIDVFMANQLEAERLTGHSDPGRAAQALFEGGVMTVVVKDGAKGAYVLSSEAEGWIPGFEVAAVDSTGAGDAFAGGLVFGLAQGWAIAQSATFANAVGALCVMHIGATEGIVNRDDTLAFIRQRGRLGDWDWSVHAKP